MNPVNVDPVMLALAMMYAKSSTNPVGRWREQFALLVERYGREVVQAALRSTVEGMRRRKACIVAVVTEHIERADGDGIIDSTFPSRIAIDAPLLASVGR